MLCWETERSGESRIFKRQSIERTRLTSLLLHSINIGMDEYLTKPLRKPDLLSMINKVVNSRRMTTAPVIRGMQGYETAAPVGLIA